MKGVRQVLLVVILGVGIFFLMQTTLQSSVVVGRSMEPSFQEGQRLIVSKVAYKFGEPEIGDVIIFHPPTSDQLDYIKRVIALPGDTVEIKTGTVYVNGSPLDEPYINDPPRYAYPQQQIPTDYYFVLGDNRNNSNDSHTGWLLPRENIIGEAWLSIWPPSEWGVVPDYSSQ
jgi:signal peptidase I